MQNIRPSSELRNNYNEIAELCKSSSDAVYITKNGTGDVVMISTERYEELLRAELKTMLQLGVDDINSGNYQTAEEAFAEIEKELGLEEV